MKIKLLILALCVGALWGLIAHSAHSATPQPVQFCPIALNKFGLPTNPTDSLRVLVVATNTQGCVQYKDLSSNFMLYGGTPHSWQSPAALGILAPQLPPVPPPPTPGTTTVSVPPQVWTCTATATLVTCTSPVVAGATP